MRTRFDQNSVWRNLTGSTLAFPLIAGIVSLLGLIHGPEAHASRARTSVLFSGDGGAVLSEGSFYYDDAYNIFYNPSYITDFTNWGIIEKSNGFSSAQAGFAATFFNFNFGFYMNRLRTLSPGTYADPGAYKPFELFLGSDMGIKWGVGLSYGRATNESQDAVLRLGMQFYGFEPFANFKIVGNELSAAGVETNNSYVLVGTRYKWGEWVPYAAFRNNRTTTGGVETVNTTVWGLGLGRNSKVAEGVKVYFALGYWNQQLLGQPAKSLFPIDLAVEGDPAIWLTIRGGFSYRTSSLGRLGATFHLGKVDLDWAFGGAVGSESLDSPTFDLANGALTQLSLSYSW